MGQYHIAVNLTKKEWLNPHKLGAGLKQCEQLVNRVGTCQALFALLCTSNHRGGGDIEGPNYNPDTGDGVLGRWAGDRLAVIGDYSEPGDMGLDEDFGAIYERTDSDEPDGWVDISMMVRPVLEMNLGIRFTDNTGWCHYERSPHGGFSVID